MEKALFGEELMTGKASLPLLSMAVSVIPPSDLQLGRPLGKGSYGEVYYSQWQGADTAVKQFYLSNLPVDLIEEFQQEAVIMANCQRPNLVHVEKNTLPKPLQVSSVETNPKKAMGITRQR